MQARCVMCNDEYETTEAFGTFYICPDCKREFLKGKYEHQKAKIRKKLEEDEPNES